MFPYDPSLIAAAQIPVASISDVLGVLQIIEKTCDDGDGLKWFNWLYLQVTEAVAARVASAGFSDPAWIANLDVQFAKLYFGALGSALSGRPSPSCWRALFGCRHWTAIARIQFALAGINAHINHDLPQAIVATCQGSPAPVHGTVHYNDYTALNTTLDGLVESAKQTLHVRLLGDPLPAVSHLEDTVAAWSVSAARETAWQNAEVLWHLQGVPPLSANFMDALDGLTTVVGKALLVPVP
ncbi:MAG TPA: DUF5995 family protein [Bryobacteraceae bacterium]|jgi:hypothetical protein|nr:DUF5995 family protein [Bryobacteraceae bacterium]